MTAVMQANICISQKSLMLTICAYVQAELNNIDAVGVQRKARQVLCRPPPPSSPPSR